MDFDFLILTFKLGLPTFALLKFWVMNAAVAYVHEQLTGKKDFPKYKAGEKVTVN